MNILKQYAPFFKVTYSIGFVFGIIFGLFKAVSTVFDAFYYGGLTEGIIQLIFSFITYGLFMIISYFIVGTVLSIIFFLPYLLFRKLL